MRRPVRMNLTFAGVEQYGSTACRALPVQNAEIQRGTRSNPDGSYYGTVRTGKISQICLQERQTPLQRTGVSMSCASWVFSSSPRRMHRPRHQTARHLPFWVCWHAGVSEWFSQTSPFAASSCHATVRHRRNTLAHAGFSLSEQGLHGFHNKSRWRFWFRGAWHLLRQEYWHARGNPQPHPRAA